MKMEIEIIETRKYKIFGKVCGSCLERIRNENLYEVNLLLNGKIVYSELYCKHCSGGNQDNLIKRIKNRTLPFLDNFQEFEKFKNTKAYKQNIKRK